jgi:uncharacterized protein YjiS (DUF1127 family)
MSTMNLDLTGVRRRRVLGWSQVKKYFAEWRRRARDRYELAQLDDRSLKDIGYSRCEAAREVVKPFWLS